MGNSSSKPTAKTGRESYNTSTTKELPPPYDTKLQPDTIKASDVPQWYWSNKECREWLTTVLVEYGNLEKQEAESEARKFEGFGPTLFATPLKKWIDLFGLTGHGVLCLIFEKRYEKGAIPQHMTFPRMELEE